MRRWVLAACIAYCAGFGCAAPQRVPSTPMPQRRTSLRLPPPARTYVPTPPPMTRTPDPRRRMTVPAEWFPSCGRISPRWTTIVIHHSATDRGSARTFDKYHRAKGWDELGYHFVIGNGTETPDGLVEVGSRWNSQKHGAHCKTPDNYFNDHGIGICLVGDFTKTGPTRRQLESLRKLVSYLCHVCHIPPDRITTHHAVNNRTACPGTHFSVAALRRTIGASASALGH